MNNPSTQERPSAKEKNKILQQNLNDNSLVKNTEKNLNNNLENPTEYNVPQALNDIAAGLEHIFKIIPNSLRDNVTNYLEHFFQIYREQSKLSSPIDLQTQVKFIQQTINKKQELSPPKSSENEKKDQKFKRIQKGELMCIFQILPAESEKFENYIKNHFSALSISKPACQEITVVRHYLRPKDLIKNTNSASQKKLTDYFYYYVYMNFSPRINLYLYENSNLENHENTNKYSIIKRPAYFTIFDKNNNIEAYYPEIYDNTKLSTTFDSLTLKNYLIQKEIESNDKSVMSVIYDWNKA